MNTKVPKWMFIPKVPNTHVSILLSINLDLNIHSRPLAQSSIDLSTSSNKKTKLLCILPAVIFSSSSSFSIFPHQCSLSRSLTTSITRCIDTYTYIFFSVQSCKQVVCILLILVPIDQIFFMCTFFLSFF